MTAGGIHIEFHFVHRKIDSHSIIAKESNKRKTVPSTHESLTQWYFSIWLQSTSWFAHFHCGPTTLCALMFLFAIQILHTEQ